MKQLRADVLPSRSARLSASKSSGRYAVSGADKAALGRILVESIEGSARHNEQCAQFLIALAYPGIGAPLNLSCWALKLPDRLIADLVIVFRLSLELQSSLTSFEALGLQGPFRRLIEHWYPESLGLPPSTPRPPQITALRTRHDLSRGDVAKMLFVEEMEVDRWEGGLAPIPIPLWQALRILVSK